MLAEEIVSVVLNFTICWIGIIANVILLYVIWVKSPSFMKTYSILLLNTSFLDLWCCLAEFATTTRLVCCEGFSIFIYHGPLSYLGSSISHLVFSSGLFCVDYTVVTIAYSCAFRYLLLTHRAPSKTFVIIFLLLSCLAPIIGTTLLNICKIETKELEQIVSKLKTHNLKGYVSSAVNLADPYTHAIHLFVVYQPVPVIILILGFRRAILRILKKNEKHMSPSTLKINRQLIRTLTIQACLPIFMVLFNIIYLIMYLDYNHSPLLEVSMFTVFSVIPAIAPFVTFFSISPYKDTLRRVVNRIVSEY